MLMDANTYLADFMHGAAFYGTVNITQEQTEKSIIKSK